MRSKVYALMILGSWLTALGSSTLACETCKSGHKKKGLLDGVNILAALHKPCDTCDRGPTCGCEQEPVCGCELKPECGCEVQSSCGCDQSCDSGTSGGLLDRLFKKKCSSCDVALECGCETDSCDGASSNGGIYKGGLLGKLFKKKSCESLAACDCDAPASCDDACDSGRSSGGLLSKLFQKSSCGTCHTECDVPAPASGCTAEPECGCETGCDTACSSNSGGLLNRLMSKLHGSSACGCSETPSCACEVEPACGCESTPSCGCESACATQAVPMPINSIESDEPPPLPLAAGNSADAVNMDPIPAPPPPNRVPDAERNPFQDDNVKRLHKVPAKTIQYRKPGSYGRDYDPQARSEVRVKFSDLGQKPVESEVKPASFYEPARLSAAPTVKRLKLAPQQP